MNDYFSLLCQHLNVQPDRRGEAHCQCPACGKEPKRGQTHFSFSERGAHCFVCGFETDLRHLVIQYGLKDWELAPIKPIERQEKPKREALDFNYLALFYNHNQAGTVYRRWREYKKITDDVINKNFLGYGRFPRYSSKCNHHRLIVPIFGIDGSCIGLRGRSIDCDCGKWLSPAGSQMFLYNWQTLKNAQGKLLFIVENPIDALMLELVNPGIKAVATLGVTIWQDEYTDMIAAANPLRAIAAYDHDVPGNGGTPEMQRDWADEHHGKMPEPGGVKVVNKLLRAGVKSLLFPWPDETQPKTDIGNVIGEMVNA